MRLRVVGALVGTLVVAGSVTEAAPAAADPVSGDFFAFCDTVPPGPDLEFGNLSISADVPAQVEAGETFDIVVTGMGVQSNPFGPAPTNAVQGTTSVIGAVSPIGFVTMGTIPTQPPIVLPWPVTLHFTATGPPGTTIEVIPISGLSVGVIPGFGVVGVSCWVDGVPVVATVQVVAPTCQGEAATVTGTIGDDILTGTPGRDVIAGLAGSDTIAGLGGDDLVCGGDGSDTVDYAAAPRGVLALLGSPGHVFGGAGHDTLDSVENVTGSDATDLIVGDADANQLAGGRGVDLIAGLAGDDTLDGGPGIDLLVGGDGTDTCTSGTIVLGCEA
jgi:RTX calcium-binding nonapeptide repeat (4 copies)